MCGGTGVAVSVGSLCYTREYIGKHHDFDSRHAHFHQIEHVFSVISEQEQSLGQGSFFLDKKQVGYQWIAIDALDEYRVLPKHWYLPSIENLNLENPTWVM